MSKEKITSLASMDPQDFTNFIRLRNWKRNSELIDFNQIPQDVTNRILESFTTTIPQDTICLEYFIHNNISQLIEEFA